ncbi:hypothetical protein DRQ33_06055 [bacterium]|nr:MAG: hypothetical protein DRQ33_06055 [bacterium]
MKKSIGLSILLFSCILWAYHITNFDVEVMVRPDASIVVTENIQVDFDGETRHGIYRDIIYKYKTKFGNNYNLRIDIIDVTDGNNKKRPFKISHQGKNVHIRIGNPNKYVTGVQNYVIIYRVTRAINFFNDYDELWWEVTGHKWEVPIHSASATVYLPSGTNMDNVKATCYTGKWGSDAQDCQWTVVPDGIRFVSGYLNSMEGFSVVVGIPKGIITPPSAFAKFKWFVIDNWDWIICFPLPFIVFIYLIRKWYKIGRDPMKNTSVMVRYNPPEEVTPAEMGTIMDERADISDITSTIVDLAVRGYLKIVEIESKKLLFLKDRDYALVLLKDYKSSEDINSFEKNFLDALFSVGSNKETSAESLGIPEGKQVILISTLKNKFYTRLKSLQSQLYTTLVKKKYFPQNPETVRGTYGAVGLMLLIVGIVGIILLHRWSILWGGIGSAISFFIFAPIMPRKTKKGAALTLHAKGFEEFVRRAEKDRIERLAKDDPTVFERLLPYAMVLGCADEWTEKFKDIFDQPPSWYVSSRPMTTYMFINSLGNALNSMNGAVSSRPRGSGASGGGSGFSGGGFGGGGGGAW